MTAAHRFARKTENCRVSYSFFEISVRNGGLKKSAKKFFSNCDRAMRNLKQLITMQPSPTRFRTDQKIVCFEGKIRQVVSNFVSNAIDAMHPKGGRLLLRTRAATNLRTGEQSVALTIADTGIGMLRKTVQNLFEPFFTTKGHGGTGLGLWMS